MSKLLTLLLSHACILLCAKEVVVVDSMIAGAVKFSVPEGSVVRAERAADDGEWFSNQAFIFDVNAGYLVTTLQFGKWPSSKSFDLEDPSVRVFFHPAGSVKGRVFGDVRSESFGTTRAFLQMVESSPAPGVPAVPGRLFSGKPVQDGIPEFRDARFSSRCLVNFGGAIFLFNVCGRNAEQVGQLVGLICSSVSLLSSGIATSPQLDSAPYSVTLEHSVVRFTPVGPFKINGSQPGPVGSRYVGNVLINSLDGTYTISMCESPVNQIDRGSDDELRIKLCRGVFAASGGDNAHSKASVFRPAGKTVTCVRVTSSNSGSWNAQCIIVEDWKKVAIFVNAHDQSTLDRLLGGILPQ